VVTALLGFRPREGTGALAAPGGTMRSETRTISLQVRPEKVVQLLADPRNLPRWAVGFAKGIRSVNGRWMVTAASGEVGIRIEADPRSGVVDFWMSPAPGIETFAGSRVLPNGGGSEYVFTQFQAPGMPDEVFDKNVRALEHELTVLRALLEVECPA
jgi:hypothetical protein